ncbi:ATP-binding protein [Streptomyces sp. NBC_00620]|uniref:ATP-binding protein n=1 Tax=Streptomyces sp. NBC_00620 TaxID=2903666 RepID=UPI002256E650|nr:ATP-binding protein [Streptomyces sp. NBC_00620]MCX4976253.1 ATP-binding protein [Streptomyces sp. NBC_00620]
MSNHPSPQHSRLELACEDTAARWARAHARDVLRKWAIPEGATNDALLVISELVTNAVRHTKKPDAPPPWATTRSSQSCVLTLWCTPEYLLIYVYDHDRTPPVRRVPSPTVIGGHGLLLVEALSAEWGYQYPTPTSGKSVYAKLILPGHPVPSDVVSSADELQLPPPRTGGPVSFSNDPHTMHRVRQGLAHG